MWNGCALADWEKFGRRIGRVDQDHSSNWAASLGSFQFICPHTHTLTCKHMHILGLVGANYLMKEIKSCACLPRKRGFMMQHFSVDVWFTVWQAGDDVGWAPAFTHSLLIWCLLQRFCPYWMAWPCPFMNRRGCRVQAKTSVQPTHMSTQVWNEEMTPTRKTCLVYETISWEQNSVGQLMFPLISAPTLRDQWL